MTNSEIKGKFSVLYPNLPLAEDNKDSNVDYILERLIIDYLHVRDKWVNTLAYCGHQTKQFVEDAISKLTLAENKDTSNIILGKLSHSKSFVPFFPLYSFKDGVQCDFKKQDNVVKEISKINVKCNRKNITMSEHTNGNVLNAISDVERKVKLLNENREYFCDHNCVSPSENVVFQLYAQMQ